jgi:hypothetical protein
MYVQVASLPVAVQQALSSLGFAKKDISVEMREKVNMSSNGMDGQQAYFCLVNLTTGQFETKFGSWGGPNMFNPKNLVDNLDKEIPLPVDYMAIDGMHGGRGNWATVYVNPANVAKYLPAPVEVTQREKDILAVFRLTSAGRKDYMRGIKSEEIQSLISRGFLKANKAGAISMTVEGKNAAQGGQEFMLGRR